MKYPDQKTLLEMLRYDPETGYLFWKARTREKFSSNRLYKAWNTRNAGRRADTSNARGYRAVHFLSDGRSRPHLAHRLAWIMETGSEPNYGIDHINGIPSDNRIENLRDVTQAENLKNLARPRNNTSGVVGVSWRAASECWVAYIKLNRKRIHLGYFPRKRDAVLARKSAEKKHGFHENHGRSA